MTDAIASMGKVTLRLDALWDTVRNFFYINRHRESSYECCRYRDIFFLHMTSVLSNRKYVVFQSSVFLFTEISKCSHLHTSYYFMQAKVMINEHN